jgi:hypothetical protein
MRLRFRQKQQVFFINLDNPAVKEHTHHCVLHMSRHIFALFDVYISSFLFFPLFCLFYRLDSSERNRLETSLGVVSFAAR